MSLAVAALSGCGSLSQPSPPSSGNQGTAQVAYAGSLATLNETVIGPKFEKATGYKYQGRGGGSLGLAHEISAHTISANVFESIGFAPIQIASPRKPWGLAFASSPLVLAYNSSSRFAPALNAIRTGKQPLSHLFAIMAEPGFHLGRTNPNTDPQGQAFWWMIHLAALRYHLSPVLPGKILGSVSNSHQIFSEEGILTNLQSGGLDAASAFLPEALARHLDYIPLPSRLNFSDPKDASWYHRATVILSNGQVVHGVPLTVDITAIGPSASAANKFIQYVTSKKGQTLMKKAGYTVFTPIAQGHTNAIPKSLRP